MALTEKRTPSEDKKLTEEQSAELAGVSIETIRRFRQFGLLRSTTVDDKTLFSEDEILSLFHVGRERPNKNSETQPLTTGEQENARPRSEKEFRVIPGGMSGTGGESKAPLPSAETSSPLEQAKPPAPESVVPQEAPQQRANLPVIHIAAGEVEIQTVRELVENNRILRESVNGLREERDWLRERLEKLEAFSQREQMLLLSNSETIRTLIVRKEEKRRGFLASVLLLLSRPFQRETKAIEKRLE